MISEEQASGFSLTPLASASASPDAFVPFGTVLAVERDEIGRSERFSLQEDADGVVVAVGEEVLGQHMVFGMRRQRSAEI